MSVTKVTVCDRFGATQTITAAALDLPQGALVLRDKSGALVATFAEWSWFRVDECADV